MSHPHRIGPMRVVILLIAAAALSRFLDVAPNFTAVSAAALFAGFYFRGWAGAVAVPIGAMVLSDLFLGFYHPLVMASVYGAMVLPVFLGRLMGDRPGAARIGVLSGSASVLFFLITNFAVWLTGAYGWTWAGLAACYTAAAPFFKYTLAGDLFYSAVLFGAHRAVCGLGLTGRLVGCRPCGPGAGRLPLPLDPSPRSSR